MGTTIGGIIVGVLVVLLITLFTLLIINIFSSSMWFCKVMGWHRRPNKIGFDGASNNGICPRCGAEVMQDSNGNWF